MKPPEKGQLQLRGPCDGDYKNCGDCTLTTCIGLCICIKSCTFKPIPENCRIAAGYRPLTRKERNTVNGKLITIGKIK